jgi:hypothetical protein
MSLIDTTTGEIVEYDRAAAERRAERIRLRLDAIADNLTTVLPMIREAIALEDHFALGYRSVGEYVSDRFGGALNRLPVDLRRPVVHELASAGMSTRAIAPVVGVDQATVVRDLGSSDAPASVDLPADYPAPEQPITPTEKVTGLNGKTYTRPTPRAPETPRTPPRRALTDQFFDADYDMGKAVEKVARLTEDDRFPQNAEKVAAKHRNDLIRSRDLLQQVIDRLA